MDVYSVGVSLKLTGNLERQMGTLLREMRKVETEAKKVQKAIDGWGIKAGAFNSIKRLENNMRGMVDVAKRTGRDMNAGLRPAFNGAQTEARAVRSTIQGWGTAATAAAGKINSAASAMRRASGATSGGVGGIRRGHRAGGGSSSGGSHGGHGGLLEAGAGYGAYAIAKDIISQSSEMRHTELGMRQTGGTPEQINQAKALSYGLSAKFRNLSPNEIFSHINDLRGILGTLEHAIDSAPDIMPEFSALKAKAGMHGSKHAINEIYTAVKSAETANEITHEGVKSHVNALTRLSFWYGERLNPSQYFSAQKTAGQGLTTTSERFRYGPFAALTQEIGQRAGTQFGTYFAKGAAGLKMTGAGLTKAFDFGLLDNNTVEWSKEHKVKPGAQFKDAHLAATDPDLFLFNKVIPALKAGGVNVDDKVELLRTLGQIFTDKNAYGFLFEMAQQRPKLDKDWAGFKGTSGEFGQYSAQDPYSAGQGFVAQLQSLATTLGNPAMEGAIRRLQDLNKGLAGISGDAGANEGIVKTLEKVIIPVIAAFASAGFIRMLAVVGTFAVGSNPIGIVVGTIVAGLTAWAELDWESFKSFWTKVKEVGDYIVGVLKGLSFGGKGGFGGLGGGAPGLGGGPGMVDDYGRPLIHKENFNTTTGMPNIGSSGLVIKPGAGGGSFHPALLGAARAGGAGRVTALNDRYHAGTGSMHARGLAVDMTGNPASIMARTRQSMAAAGLVEGRDYKMINEYAHPSRRATGGHVHFQFQTRRAADQFRSHAAPPPPSNSGSGQMVQNHIHIDGQKIAQVVTRHQVRGANGPSQGGNSYDATRLMPQVA